MKKYLIAATAASVALIPGAAMAQAGGPFTGPRIEALVGYDNVGVDARGPGDHSESGVAYGAGIGYDVNLNGIVVGAEGEVSDSSTDISSRVGDSYQKVSAGRDLYAGIRVGTVVSPNVLLYAKGGYTNARLKARYDDGNGFTFRDGANQDGYRLGAGAEYDMGNYFAKVEYRYSDYGKLKFDGADLGLDGHRHQVMAGVGFRF